MVQDDNRSAQLDSPTAWFCELELAIRRRNRARELTARRELARLGVQVTIEPRSVLALLRSHRIAEHAS